MWPIAASHERKVAPPRVFYQLAIPDAASTSQDEDGELERSKCTPPSPKKCRTDTAPNSHDLARCVGSAMCLSDAEKYELTDANYRFPKSTTGRTVSFQHRWMQLHPWLAYSEQKNGGFCNPCVLFATSGHHGSELGILIQLPLVCFSKVLGVLSKHAMKDYHKAAVIRAEEFSQVMRNEQPDIRSRMNQATTEIVARNRQKLASTIKTIVFCGHRNVALHGHRDNAGDKHISESAKWFTVIADEVTDISNKELLSLVLCYVDCDPGLVREDLTIFLECDVGISGHCLADKIMTTCHGKYNIPVRWQRGGTRNTKHGSQIAEDSKGIETHCTQ